MYLSGVEQDFLQRFHALTEISTFGGVPALISGSVTGTGIGIAQVTGIINGSGVLTGTGIGTISGYNGADLVDPVGSGIISGNIYYLGVMNVNFSLTVFDTGQYSGLASGTLYTGFSYNLIDLNSGLFTINQTFTGNVPSASGLLGISLPPIGGFSGLFSGDFTGSGFNSQQISGQIEQNMSGLYYETEGDLSFYLQESGLYTGASIETINTWTRELNKKLYQFSGIPSLNG